MVKPLVILIGPPGSGKTSVGARVAERLDVALEDTDARIEANEGRTIAEIFIDSGEPYFRDVERAVVLHAVGAHGGVLALGGGSPMDPEIQAALTDRRVVFLDVGIADAAKRVGFDASRPLLAVNPRARWVALMKERRGTYEALATHRVDTAGRSADEVAAEIVELLIAEGVVPAAVESAVPHPAPGESS
ncbi:shikimate kinase [Nostocoides australiense]|nr:shikimate kinase [Actinomycetota bacterium]HPF80883.1 shikimate kinase [Tetrasphaera australiensis]HRW00274.1 shikimate kinase [Tetrasphaera sp.]